MSDLGVQGTRVPAEAMRQLWLSPLPHPLPTSIGSPLCQVFRFICPHFQRCKPGLEGLLGIVYNQRHKSVSSVVFFDEWEVETSRKSAFLCVASETSYLEQSGPVLDERVTGCVLH